MWPQPTWLFSLYLCVRLVFPIIVRTANWKPGNYREEQKACNHGGFVDVNIEWILGQRGIICDDLLQKKKKQKFIISFIFRNCFNFKTQNFHNKNVFYCTFQFLKLSSLIISLLTLFPGGCGLVSRQWRQRSCLDLCGAEEINPALRSVSPRHWRSIPGRSASPARDCIAAKTDLFALVPGGRVGGARVRKTLRGRSPCVFFFTK